jgi:hypothetical protein
MRYPVSLQQISADKLRCECSYTECIPAIPSNVQMCSPPCIVSGNLSHPSPKNTSYNSIFSSTNGANLSFNSATLISSPVQYTCSPAAFFGGISTSDTT